MKKLLLILFLLTIVLPVLPQEQEEKNMEQYQEQVRQMIHFLEYMFNTIGDAKTYQQEKEIIINDSYTKIFRDEDVQIEDDLDERRNVPTNKDVQAYLKDIDFFFKHVEFAFNIDEVTHSMNENGELFFKVKLNRTLIGSAVDSDSVQNDKVRYVEINLDEKAQDLKIASIYTTKLNEKEELRNWWNAMAQNWRDILSEDYYVDDTIPFSRLVHIGDSLSVVKTWKYQRVERESHFLNGMDTVYTYTVDSIFMPAPDTVYVHPERIFRQLKSINGITEINLDDNIQIFDLEPLDQMTELRSVSLSNTLISDLMPLRGLTKLEILNVSGSPVNSLEPLRYTINIRDLNISNTYIRDLEAVSKFAKLERLYAENTPVRDLEPLEDLKQVKDLRLNNSRISDVEALGNLENLEILDISDTRLNSISTLRHLENLNILRFNNTPVRILDPLINLPQLVRVYCDNTMVDRELATAFMKANPQCLVIYESQELEQWWRTMDASWKEVFRQVLQINSDPTAEQLHELSNIEILDIKKLDITRFARDNNISAEGANISSEAANILNLEPVSKLLSLRVLDISGTAVEDLGPLRGLIDLKELNLANTQVNDISDLQHLSSLEYVNLNNTAVRDVSPLQGAYMLKEVSCNYCDISSLQALQDLERLEKIYADHSRLNDDDVMEFRSTNPNCLVIYQSDDLLLWWNDLSDNWQKAFRLSVAVEDEPSPEQLQRLANLEAINLSGNSGLRNLQALEKLAFLKVLDITDTQLSSIDALRSNGLLEKLSMANIPVSNLEPISYLQKLKYLDISNTPLKDFEQIQHIASLETLICPGTQIKNLKYIEALKDLQHLEISNTSVKNIKVLEEMNLEVLRCFNTGISARRVEAFKEKNPECEVTHY